MEFRRVLFRSKEASGNHPLSGRTVPKAMVSKQRPSISGILPELPQQDFLDGAYAKRQAFLADKGSQALRTVPASRCILLAAQYEERVVVMLWVQVVLRKAGSYAG